MNEWLEAELEPPFGTVDEWITEQLGRADTEELAIYAVKPERESDGHVRILVATESGLFDFVWHRPEQADERRLKGRHFRWADVVGLSLTGLTRLNDLLLRDPPEWGLALATPELTIERAVSAEALLDFWAACRKQLDPE